MRCLAAAPPPTEAEQVAPDWFIGLAVVVGLLLVVALIVFARWMQRAGRDDRAVIYTGGVDVVFGMCFPFIAVFTSLFLIDGETPTAGIALLAVGVGWLELHNIGGLFDGTVVPWLFLSRYSGWASHSSNYWRCS